MSTVLEPSVYRLQPLDKHHDRSEFCCGMEALDRYLHEPANQDAKKRVAAPFVLLKLDRDVVIGYYTLSATGIDIREWPEEVRRKLPRYPVIPATLLGRLAVDKRYQGKGLGEHLLMDVLYRSLDLSKQIASVAVVVEAKNERAKAFYASYGCVPFPEPPAKLFLVMKAIEKLFG